MSLRSWPMIALAVSAAGAGGAYAGRHGLSFLSPEPGMVEAEVAKPPLGPVLYYQDPDGKPAYALTARKTADGRDFRPVYIDGAAPAPAQAAAAAPAKDGSRNIRFYRNPMGLPDTSPTPKKDSMGMDYLPVYEGEDDEGDGATFKVSTAKLQRSGVRSETATMRVLSLPVRAPASLKLDERRQTVISLRSEGWIQEVADVTTGDHVRKGEPLMEIYSPAATSAAVELMVALGGGESVSVKAARRRLENAGVPAEAIDEMVRSRQVPKTIAYLSPSDGIVMERNATPGMQAAAGQVIFRIANHEVIWVLANVPERDLGLIAAGQPATVVTRAFPGKVFAGRVALVYPDLDPATRTARVRIELPNPEGLLKPDMYADVEIATGLASPVVAAPNSAVIDSGTRQVVIIDKGEGRFEPRPVTLGRRGDGFVQILAGLKEGERVVTSANFLLDAESNLKAALQGLAEGATP